MAVAASKVNSLCTAAEAALVRASRKPVLEKLTPAELKRNIAQARKLFDKWQGQGRQQARTQVRSEGSPDLESNTKLKAQIFREALDSFKARAAKVSVSGKPASKDKRSRAAEHRTRRAAVRKGMTATLDLVNSERAAPKPAKKSKPAAAKTVVKTPAKAAAKPAPAAVKKVGAKRKPAALPASSAQLAPPATPNPGKQLRAATVAKQARIAKSGKTTRVVGHVSARGKRAQAKRDSKG